uniref:Uncharacterized protein n=1 Tax=Lepeophtheirus salmonis TaxID=72036 RepID=A0A0K2VCD2_LEPSM
MNGIHSHFQKKKNPCNLAVVTNRFPKGCMSVCYLLSSG